MERDIISEVGELSKLNRELNNQTIESLRGKSGNYVNRLQEVAQKTFRRSYLLGGTTISRPSIIKFGNGKRLKEELLPPGFAMYTRDIRTTEGFLVMFPMHTVGLTKSGTPIINPELNKISYTIAHLPARHQRTFQELSNPSSMIADLTFTVDQDDLVTINGMNPVTAKEFMLFDDIVKEFENRAFPEQN